MKKIKTPKQLNSILKQITDKFHPQKAILFGSYAYGRPEEWSDVDLMVIMETQERPLRVAAKISAFVDHPFPLDIPVKTPEQIKERLSMGDSFIKDIMENGILLYRDSRKVESLQKLPQLSKLNKKRNPEKSSLSSNFYHNGY